MVIRLLSNRFFSLLVIALLIMGMAPGQTAEGAKSHDVVIGSYVSMGTYNGRPIMWRVIAHNENGTFLFADRVITFKAFNSARYPDEPRDGALLNFHGTGLGDRYMWGNNMWETSTLREWLNSDRQTVSYTRMPPERRYLYGGPNEYITWRRERYGDEDSYGGANAYAHEPGFLTNFLTQEKNAIAEVRQKTLLMEFDREVADGGKEAYPFFYGDYHQDYDNAYFHWTTDRVFLLCLSDIERYLAPNFQGNEDYINNLFIGRATAEALENDDSRVYQEQYHPESLTWGNKSADQVDYWLRTPGNDWGGKSIGYVLAVAASGAIEEIPAYRGIMEKGYSSVARCSPGVRPALYLKPNTELSGGGTESNPYRIAGDGNPSPAELPSESSKSIDVYLNGIKQVFTDQPVMVDNRVLLPMRVLFEALGAEVAWDPQSNTAAGFREGIEVRIPIDSTSPTINGKPARIDVPARLIDGRTYIPLRFVGEAFGDEVEWNGHNYSVWITGKTE